MTVRTLTQHFSTRWKASASRNKKKMAFRAATRKAKRATGICITGNYHSIIS